MERLTTGTVVAQAGVAGETGDSGELADEHVDETADVVVVGAGSAGAPVAVRLTERPDRRVLLLEAGPADPGPAHRVPAMFPALQGGVADWCYHTEPQPGLGGRRLDWPQGKTLGGSSSINAMMWVRGFADDYEEWAARAGHDWDYGAMVGRFRRIEDTEGAGPGQGRGGPIPVSRQRDPHPLTEMFLRACAQAGVGPAAEVNGATTDGAVQTMVTQRDGRRWSTADGYLRAAGERPNLRVRTGAHVTRVIFRGRDAVGVEYVEAGRRRRVRATGQVVLCGGAVNSAHLLLLSGVGPAAELRRHGIRVVHDLPAVGDGLRDHLFVPLVAACSRPTIQAAFTARALAAHRRHGTGPMTSNLTEAYAFVRSRPGLRLPDLELLFAPGSLSGDGRHGADAPSITLGPVLLRPESSGRVTLRSPDPFHPPAIDPRYLTDPAGADRRVLLAGVRWCRRILAAPPLARVVTPPATTNGVIEAAAQTLYHPVGTCRMGNDPGSVVDEALRVRGVRRLRVADASVFPNLIRGHTHAACVAIGERAAELVAAATT